MALDLRSFAEVVRLSDGAWGTELQKLGLPPGAPPELWNTERPEAVEAVARSYVEAGCDVILTNTFGGNAFVLERHGAAGRAAELVEAGVAISRRAAGEQAKVFASIGPTGKILMMGEEDENALAVAFAEAAGAAERGGADALVFETFNEIAELGLAVGTVRGVCDLPIVCSMTFASGPDGVATLMGQSPGDLACAADGWEADAVGANCGAGPDNYVRVAALLREATDLPIWIKANAGLPQLGPDGQTTFPMGPDEFASFVPALIEAGANFLGGCCGTTPEHLRRLRAAVDACP